MKSIMAVGDWTADVNRRPGYLVRIGIWSGEVFRRVGCYNGRIVVIDGGTLGWITMRF